MLHQHSDEGFTQWLEQVQSSGIEELVSFAKGMMRDEAAVRAGLSLTWNQGPVEGAVNRLKLIKRSMYGRAKFDLLRTRVLCIAWREELNHDRPPVGNVGVICFLLKSLPHTLRQNPKTYAKLWACSVTCYMIYLYLLRTLANTNNYCSRVHHSVEDDGVDDDFPARLTLATSNDRYLAD